MQNATKDKKGLIDNIKYRIFTSIMNKCFM